MEAWRRLLAFYEPNMTLRETIAMQAILNMRKGQAKTVRDTKTKLVELENGCGSVRSCHRDPWMMEFCGE